jgi:signal transduction histidine kinase
MNRAKFIKKEFPNPTLNDLFKVYANDIHHEMHNLEKAVDFILGYATIDENLEKFDIKAVIEDLFNYSIRSVLDKENINYKVTITESVFITYNKKVFEDIIENLITNSIKALEDIENKQILCEGYIKEGEFILYFSDNGIGIEEEKKDKIFEIYETSTKEQGGSGIGLFSVKTRLNSLSGDIEVIESKLQPTGATFKITLPFKN